MKHLHSLSYKILFSIFFFAIAGIIFFLKIGEKNITKVSATWWDDSWHYRRSISITNSSGIAQTNVIVKVLNNYDLSSLVSLGKIQSDLDDLRFTNSSDTLVSHWITDATNTSADVWVILPSLPVGGTDVWMYYGNSAATSTSTAFYSYTSTNEFVDDGLNGFRIKLKNNGNLTFSIGVGVSAFLVGGGGGSVATSNGGGAGGGYTTTGTNISISVGTSYAATIGSGGAVGSQGGTTQFASLSAVGGYPNSGSNGGNGGSGGGYGGPYMYGYYCCAGPGASNGAGAGGNCADGGTGQGTPTYEFGGSSGDLYAGGGGGYGGYNSACGNNWKPGGAGGGGDAGAAGTTNTGGGAGANGYVGGSGVVVIRYISPGPTNLNIYEENNFGSSGNSWWDTDWLYRQSISISNSCSTNETNAIVKVLNNYDASSLITAGKLQSDLDDIRFVDSNGNSLIYWIQDSTNSSVDIWAIIPSLPTAGTSIYMYYGNPSATSVNTALYTYTGSNTSIDDGTTQFRVKFLTNGTLNLTTSMTIDAFLVGGGAAGNMWSASEGAGGGGAGYTATHNDISVTNSTSYPIVIGIGGTGGWGDKSGQASSAFGYSAAGGANGGTGGIGGNGGSGGGGYPAGFGGSNGSNGQTVNFAGGVGQGTTTREFGETSGDLYCYGGNSYNNRTANGTGGLGATTSTAATAGAANSGSGGGAPYYYSGSYSTPGAGGSGIVVIRYTSCGTASSPTNEESYTNPTTASACLIDESYNDTQLTPKWQDNSSYEEGFYIQKSTDSGTWTALYTADPDITNYTDTSISSNHTYQYRIAPFTSGTTTYDWCYTPTLNLGRGNFDFEGLNLEGINLD